MRIHFNYPQIRNAFEMIQKIGQWISLDKIYDSSMEDAYHFTFQQVDFFIQYIRDSEENGMIYMYSIESNNENSQQGTQIDKEATQLLFDGIKRFCVKISLEKDDFFV